jgi:DNA helicase-2/ATP-dependent DNA helicase PcrA
VSGHDFAALLSKSQYEAATTLDVPLCILAGAGTGKTRVITHRIAYLIERGAVPDQILGLTFTNKAAKEMRERVERLLPGVSYRVQLGTFHGLSAKILRRYGPYVDVSSSFLIYDQDDSQRLMKQIAVEQLNISRDHLALHAFQIERWQNEGLLPHEVDPGLDHRTIKTKELYSQYWQRLAQVGALDFNGLLLKWRELLSHPEGSKRLKEQYRHILVDEYQDTNTIQDQIVHKLGEGADSIAIVGDDDQSIYSWRGARPGNMQQFLDTMPGAKLVKLEENYRSTSTILRAANGVISNNQSRLGKTLYAVGGTGLPVQIVRAFNDRSEADLIINMIEDDLARGQSLSDFAVLMRTNAQSRSFEESLRRARLPYRLVGGVKFYDRKEVKDVLATLRAALNPKSDVDVLRALAAIPRGIGDASIKKAGEVAVKHEVPLMDVLLSQKLLAEAKVNAKTASKIIEFAERLAELGQRALPPQSRSTVQTLKAELKKEAGTGWQGDLWQEAPQPPTPVSIAPMSVNAEQAVNLAIEVSGVAERLQAEKTPEAQDRLDNIGQLLSAAQQHVEEASTIGANDDALSFLEATALLSSADDFGKDAQHYNGAVTLMTLHAAKGLEFDVVYMVGMEEYGFPHARALEEDADETELEEERRLAYVGMTRAKKRLYLTYAQRRMIRGVVKGRAPSRFLRELPRDAVSGDIPPAYSEQQSTDVDHGSGMTMELDPTFLPQRKKIGSRTTLSPSQPRWSTPALQERDPVDRAVRIELDPDFADGGSDDANLKSGTRVWHTAFGSGTVLEKRGSGRLSRAVVRFDRDGKQRAIISRHLRVV